jgi:hypothetical protein
MANNVIGLFENDSIAESVVEELLASGFNRTHIKRFQGNNDQLEDELRHEGIPADEASYYVNGLNEGGALVSVRAEESETDNAVEIMNRYVNAGQSGSDSGNLGATSDWGSSTDSSAESKSVAADTADYDGAGSSASGGAVGRDAYASYNKSTQESPSTPAPSGSGVPVGRDAYASYQKRERPAQTESAAPAAHATSSAGFPIGRKAYEAYSRDKQASFGSNSDTWASETAEESATMESTNTSGLSVGREAYEAYSRDKAAKWGK